MNDGEQRTESKKDVDGVCCGAGGRFSFWNSNIAVHLENDLKSIYVLCILVRVCE